MRKEIAKYMGKQGACYYFSSQRGDKILFTKCRKDLINQFGLDGADSINQWFHINFFQASPNGKSDDFTDKINIISDLMIINQ